MVRTKTTPVNLNNSEKMNSQTFQAPEPSIFAPLQPEQNFQRSFQPLTSRKDGKAQLTFSGYKHSITKDGEKAFLQVVFSVLDVTHQNPANICINSNYKYSEGNLLGRLLTLMGYEHKLDIVITDEDDEFAHIIDEDLNQIYLFLDNQKGLMFKGFCNSEENKKGEWWYRIKVDSLEPLFDKNGVQKRAYDASEGLSENELQVDIEARGGDE